MSYQELLLTAMRAVAVYVLMLIVVRALGKRTIGNFAAFDLLVRMDASEERPAPPLSRVAEYDLHGSNDGQVSCQVDGRIT